MGARRIVSRVLAATALAGCVSTAPAGGVLVVEDESRVRGCRVLGTVADSELDDLQKKASRIGGNVALLTPQRKAKGGWFGLQDYMTADVYLCESGRSREPVPPSLGLGRTPTVVAGEGGRVTDRV